MTINSGGTLAGTGTVTGAVTVNSGGFLSPGNSVGTLTVGSVSFASGSTLLVTLNGLTPVTQYSVLHVTGTASLGNANLSGTTGFSPVNGNTFQVITAASISGSFAASVAGVGNKVFSLSYPSGTSVVLTNTALVWSGLGSNNLWSNPANWVGNVAATAGDALVFTGTTQQSTQDDLSAGTSIASISFSNGGFTLSGNSVSLTTPGGGVFDLAGAIRLR